MKILEINGVGDKDTVSRLQQYLGVTQYGEITIKKSLHKWCPAIKSVEYADKPSDTVKALQKWLGFKNPDGLWGEITSRNLQKRIGIENPDGIFGPISVKALQRFLNYAPFKSDKVIIGHAAANERGGLAGGKAGDQTGREVTFSNWSYSATKGAYSHWMYVFRAKDPTVRLKLARAMMDTCNNNLIGYDTGRPDRFTAYDEAERKFWNIAAIDRKCETTCSQAVSMCMRAAGISKEYAPRFCDIATLTRVMLSDKQFDCYTDPGHLIKSVFLQPGDILLSGHHTAIVVMSPITP